MSKELKPVEVVKCACGAKVCNTYGLNIGTFYQGCGFDKALAEAICRKLNAHAALVEALEKIAGETAGGPHVSAAAGLKANWCALMRVRERATAALKLARGEEC